MRFGPKAVLRSTADAGATAQRASGQGLLAGRGGCLVHWFELGPMQNLVYLLEDRATGQAAVVDPAWDAPLLLALAETWGLRITDVLITHAHDDHVNALDTLLARTGARTHLSRVEAAVWPGRPADALGHAHGERIVVGELEVELVLTPGHTPGSACYAVENFLLTGGTLLVYGCGRCDLPGGDAHAMHRSLMRLAARFPDDTLILPGHHYATQVFSTLGRQRWGNPFLHFDDPDAFAAFRAEHNRHRHPPYQPVPPGMPAW